MFFNLLLFSSCSLCFVGGSQLNGLSFSSWSSCGGVRRKFNAFESSSDRDEMRKEDQKDSKKKETKSKDKPEKQAKTKEKEGKKKKEKKETQESEPVRREDDDDEPDSDADEGDANSGTTRKRPAFEGLLFVFIFLTRFSCCAPFMLRFVTGSASRKKPATAVKAKAKSKSGSPRDGKGTDVEESEELKKQEAQQEGMETSISEEKQKAADSHKKMDDENLVDHSVKKKKRTESVFMLWFLSQSFSQIIHFSFWSFSQEEGAKTSKKNSLPRTDFIFVQICEPQPFGLQLSKSK